MQRGNVHWSDSAVHPKGGSSSPTSNRGMGEEIWLVALGISAFGLLSMSYLRYILLAVGLSLIFLSFRASDVLFFPFIALGFLLVISSVAIGAWKSRGQLDQSGSGGSPPGSPRD